jgi:DNA polymerase-3 subunit beta
MKFSIEKNDLLNNIQHLYQIVPTKNTMPILTNYLVESSEETNKIKFTATDMEITVVVEFDAVVSQTGKAAVMARNMNEMINRLPEGMIHFEKEDDNLKVLCNNIKFTLLCADYNQFPIVPKLDLNNTTRLNAEMFKKMVDNTHFAVSTETNRPIFTGIYWKVNADYQLMVATDGKKIAEFKLHQKTEIPDEVEQIIPTKGLVFLDKVFQEDIPEISYLIEPNRVIFVYGNYIVFSHVIEGKFPDYSRAIPPDNKNILKIKNSLFKEAVKRISLMASEDTFRIKLSISSSSFIMNSVKREEGDAVEQLEDFNYVGEKIEIAFNYKFLISILNVLETEIIELRLGEPNGPVLFFNVGADESFTARFLLMPLRLG